VRYIQDFVATVSTISKQRICINE